MSPYSQGPIAHACAMGRTWRSSDVGSSHRGPYVLRTLGIEPELSRCRIRHRIAIGRTGEPVAPRIRSVRFR